MNAFNIRRILFTLGLVFSALFLGACALLGVAPGAPASADAIYTQAAETVMVQLTQQAFQTVAAGGQVTQQPVQVTQSAPTATPTQQVVLVPTATFAPTAVLPTAVPPTQVPPTRIPPTPVPCDWAEFVKDVSVPDGSTYSAGAPVTKVWRLRNIGSCTWGSGYSVVFSSGNAMGSRSSYPLNEVVYPGDVVDVEVELQAPSQEGRHKGYWMLRNANGYVFGIGAGAGSAFWVDIRVSTPINSNYAYDFAANYCKADWNSSTSSLDCGGDSDDRDGSVNLLNNPDLETRNENEPALWVRPSRGNGGWTVGQYPSYTIRSGDRFLAEVGCMEGNRACNLTFQLEYVLNNGTVKNLGSWREVYDGGSSRIDIDLSSLAGTSVQFRMTTYNNGDWEDASGYWFVPRIQNFGVTPPPTPQMVLEWRQVGGIAGVCQDIKIYLTGTSSAEAHAYNCSEGRAVELGYVRLNDGELNQVVQWVNRLKSFEAQQGSTNPADGMVIRLNFSGRGGANWTDADFQAMHALAQRFYSVIAQ